MKLREFRQCLPKGWKGSRDLDGEFKAETSGCVGYVEFTGPDPLRVLAAASAFEGIFLGGVGICIEMDRSDVLHTKPRG
jgi:hypothetical protein